MNEGHTNGLPRCAANRLIVYLVSYLGLEFTTVLIST